MISSYKAELQKKIHQLDVSPLKNKKVGREMYLDVLAGRKRTNLCWLPAVCLD